MQDFERYGESYDENSAQLAQEKTRSCLKEIKDNIHIGMTEKEAEKIAAIILRKAGARKFWHPVHIRFGANTTKGYREDSEPDVVLKKNDIFFIDIGPVFDGHEGDYGQTFVAGAHNDYEVLAGNAEIVWNKVRAAWKNNAVGYELWEKAKEFAAELNCELAPLYVKGHRISDFPHEMITRNKMFDMNTVPAEKRWVLEIQIIDPKLNRGAFYEDILV